MNTHATWMQYALDLSERALPQDVPVGAVILDPTGSILAEGWNTREQHHDPTAHAEIKVLQLAGKALQNWRLSGCTLYVTLEPCPMCAAAILQARLSTVVFGASDPLQGAFGSALNLTTLYGSNLSVLAGILENACQSHLSSFFQWQRHSLHAGLPPYGIR